MTLREQIYMLAAISASLLFTSLLATSVYAQNSSVVVGDPTDASALGQQLSDAYKTGARNIVIKPGTYYLAAPGDSQILLDHWQNAEISAYKVILIVDNSNNTGHLFRMDTCTNVTIAGPILSQTAQPAYQGQITAIGTDSDGNTTCNWRPSVGYPVPTPDMTQMWIDFVDDKTKTIDAKAGEFYHDRLESLGDGSFRMHLDKSPAKFPVGDWLVCRYGNPPTKIGMTGCNNCTIEDVTMMRNGFAPIFDGEGGNNHYIRVHWALGPKPKGAVDDPIVTNAADGIHSPDDTIGPDLENCTFSGVFLDDCIAIHGVYNDVKSSNGSQIVAGNNYAFYVVGEPVRISNDQGFYLQANVTALTDNHDGTDTLTLDSNDVVPSGCHLSNPLHDGAGYKIINCVLGNTRSRGIICKSDNGIIENCTVTHCGLGIRIGPEWPSESDYSQNVVVEGNKISNCWSGLQVDGSGDMENKNITIQHNAFLSNVDRDVQIGSADGVVIKDNYFSAPTVRPDWIKPSSPISLWQSQNIAIGGNKILTPSAYATTLVNVGNNVSSVTQDPPAP